MNTHMNARTVAAISTPYGKGGVALIRISGPQAVQIAQKVCQRKNGAPLAELSANRTAHVLFTADGQPFDDGMATLFRAPHSFTGEDTAELCCHGGIYVTQKLLGAVLAAGASPAGAGEFTRRAFQNGKLTLSQAEAIGGLIDAKNDSYLTVSLLQCRGALSGRLNALCERLKGLLASVYAYIDYPDEDMTDVPVPVLRQELETLTGEVDRLCNSHAYGKAISEGIKTVLIGKPNTGKSALLNALAGEDRAIVTEIAGTTRDVIQEQIRLGDLLLRLSDTAGVRESSDRVEQLGITRSLSALQKAELVFAVFDGSCPPDDEDEEVLRLLREKGDGVLYLVNKSDLGEPNRALLALLPEQDTLLISAKDGSGLDALAAAVRAKAVTVEPHALGEVVVGARQFAALSKARTHLQNAVCALDGFTQDVAGLDMEQALGALEEVDGRTASEEIVNEIFSRFCVGK